MEKAMSARISKAGHSQSQSSAMGSTSQRRNRVGRMSTGGKRPKRTLNNNGHKQGCACRRCLAFEDPFDDRLGTGDNFGDEADNNMFVISSSYSSLTVAQGLLANARRSSSIRSKLVTSNVTIQCYSSDRNALCENKLNQYENK